MPIRLGIPSIPPSSNHAYMNNGFGGRTLSPKGQLYKKETIAHLARTYPNEMRYFKPNVLYCLFIILTFRDVENKGWPKKTANRYKKLDVTNRLKLLEDALQEATGIDDSQHVMVTVYKNPGLQETTSLIIWEASEEVPVDVLRLLGASKPHGALSAMQKSWARCLSRYDAGNFGATSRGKSVSKGCHNDRCVERRHHGVYQRLLAKATKSDHLSCKK